MTDSKVYMFPDSNNNSGSNNSNVDPALLYAMMNNNGGFGGNGGFLWVIFLFFLYPLLRNGGFFGNGNGYGSNDGSGLGSLGNLVNNDAGRELLMQAINRNGDAISNLANMFNTSSDNISQAICGLNTAIANVGAATNLSGEQVKNAIQNGNMNLASQLSTCCCNLRESISNQTYQLTNQINNVATGQERGFSSIAYATQQQTCDINNNLAQQTQNLKDNATSNTTAIIAKLDGIEKSALQAKIDALQEAKSTLTTQINLEHQNVITGQQIAAAVAPINATLAGIQKEVNDIKSAQPATITTPYQPFVAVPNCIAAQMGLYGYSSVNNGFWY